MTDFNYAIFSCVFKVCCREKIFEISISKLHDLHNMYTRRYIQKLDNMYEVYKMYIIHRLQKNKRQLFLENNLSRAYFAHVKTGHEEEASYKCLNFMHSDS